VKKKEIVKELNWAELKKLRERLIKIQKGKCPICTKQLNNPVLDHHHTKRIKGTGRCRQVICATCNVFLAKIENNCKRYCIQNEDLPLVLRRIADYLEREPTKYLHPSERVFEKLKKSDYNKIKKYYFKMYPNRRSFPEYPKSKKLTKKFKDIMKDLRDKGEKI